MTAFAFRVQQRLAQGSFIDVLVSLLHSDGDVCVAGIGSSAANKVAIGSLNNSAAIINSQKNLILQTTCGELKIDMDLLRDQW